MTTETPDMDRNVTAFFNTRDEAEQAITHLTESGLPRDRILLRTGAARKAAFSDDGKGLLQEVKELILPSEEPDAAVAALKHEGFLLSARPEPDKHDAIVDLLERIGGLCVESRADIWPDWKSCADQAPSDDLIDAGPDHETTSGEAESDAGPSEEAGAAEAETEAPQNGAAERERVDYAAATPERHPEPTGASGLGSSGPQALANGGR